MLNQVVLVGRIVETYKVDDDKVIMTIRVPRYYKNENEEYDSDFINCVLNGQIAKNTMEYCNSTDIIGVKGRIESNDDRVIMIVAEKVTFLSTNKRKEEE